MMKQLLLICFIVLLMCSCRGPEQKAGLHFTILPAAETGVDFNNTITESDSLNMFINEYTYMGGGVGVGDFNNDGLQDIFFAGNQVSSQLYINKGDFRFEEVTKKAGLATTAWCTGVSVVDINNDGWPDIYVSVSGKLPGTARKNLLFINRHNTSFTEEAAAYGLADTAYSTQAVFFDYDKDGRLDMYLLNHTLNDDRPNDIRDKKVDSNAVAADKLYHNEGIPAGMDHPVFKNVSMQAGISEDGNGLGVVVSDFNNDGYPDIYVANDYIRNDILWLNNKDGSFSNCIASAVKHQSYSSMGTDAADLNNDGLPDIITLDMQPETNRRKKMMYSFLTDQRHQLEMNKGYEPEFIHNMLQLNNGSRFINNRTEPFFSEIGEMAGIAETDWSWSALVADLDNDGWKDIHISNGMGRDPTNIDFLEYRRNIVLQTGIPDNNLAQRHGFIEHLAALGSVSLHNYIYRSNGSLVFEDVSTPAGINQTSISNGAVYADLDNDGRLDIITSNINSPAFIMRNDSRPVSDTAAMAHHLTIQLRGDSLNRDGIGAVLYAYCRGSMQMLEQFPVRGYLSSVDPRLHIGSGGNTPDSIRIVWPGNRTQLIIHPAADSILRLSYTAATDSYQPVAPPANLFFTDRTQQSAVDFQHRETFFYDYGFQPLIQQKYSQEGPFISTGDINGDGREDFFIGGAYKQPGRIFTQEPNGNFEGRDLLTGTKNEEDMQSVLFDADGDKDLDLLLVSGSTEFDANSSFYRPRLYLNDGKGNYLQDSTAFSPLVRTPGKCVAVADFDGDGDVDVFIGGRVSLGAYPLPPRSYLLRNEHGKFTDVTSSVCAALENPGLLNAATWMDMDNDKKPDLIIAGDWMPIRIFKNTGTLLTEITQAEMKNLPGFWRSLAIADIDKDGDLDIVAGNLGLNNPYHITAQQPAALYAKDVDGNGVTEPIFCYFIKQDDGQYQLSAGISRDEWAMQMPSIKKKFDHNELYAKASMQEIVDKDITEGALKLTCKEVRSGWFENNGRGLFNFHALPLEVQMAPVNSIVCADINHDGRADLILAGNEYQSNVTSGRYDASYGQLLLGNDKGNFESVPALTSGLVIDGDTRDLTIITVAGRRLLLAAVNNDKMKVFEVKK